MEVAVNAHTAEPVVAIVVFDDDIAVVVVGVDVDKLAALFEVVDAADAPRFLAGFAQCGQEHGGKNGDDGNDDQQFDQGKTRNSIHDPPPIPCW